MVSPIGIGKESYWQALKEGKNGVGIITLFDASKFPVRIAAEVKDFSPDKWMDHKEARRSDRVIQFAVAAADMAIEDAKLDVGSLDPHKFGVYLGSGEGGIATSYDNIKALIEKGPSRVSPFFIPMMISNMPAAYVAIRHGAHGPNLCAVTACATATHTMGEAYHSIKRGEADVILAGGAEAAITPVGVAGFAAMKALSTRNDAPERASRPFDVDRDGFVLGEGAGVLVFEELEHALSRGAHIYAELVGYGNTCDAYHITAPDPTGEGPIRAMALAVSMAGWKLEEVDLINAHGTSTPLNDEMEGQGYSNAFWSSCRFPLCPFYQVDDRPRIGRCRGVRDDRHPARHRRGDHTPHHKFGGTGSELPDPFGGWTSERGEGVEGIDEQLRLRRSQRSFGSAAL